jgi:hypothetical protein
MITNEISFEVAPTALLHFLETDQPAGLTPPRSGLDADLFPNIEALDRSYDLVWMKL